MGPPSGDWGGGERPQGPAVRPEDPDDVYYVSVTKSEGADSENVKAVHPTQASLATDRPLRRMNRGLSPDFLLKDPVRRRLAVDSGGIEDRQHIGIDVDYQVQLGAGEHHCGRALLHGVGDDRL